MSQNTSSAVMAQRHEPNDSLEFFPTPPWATRAVVRWLNRHGQIGPSMTAWDPCSGRGHMVRPLREYFREVRASDVFDHGAGAEVEDFLFPGAEPRGEDWIFFNFPFRLGLEFITRALSFESVGVAALARTAFLEGGGRFEGLFKVSPPSVILQFAERVIMAKDRCRDPALPYWDAEAGRKKKPSTATAYCWIVWFPPPRPAETKFDWIPPCRRDLECPGDYDPSEQPPEKSGLIKED
ncbi:methyltransferase [Nisaea sediminum]|uniref:methyltransferase n=1 Tax=Nisaea sediminum TaxID=2775867 RepID=UPI0018695BB6|nr:methyltransferase [Nisaea sediminum]